MKLKQVILVLIFFLIAYSVNAQLVVEIDKKEFQSGKEGFKDAWSAIKDADDLYEQGPGGRRVALDLYLYAYQYNQKNAELNYKIGACYIDALFKARAITYLTDAYLLKPNVAADIHFLLGAAFQLNYQFDTAIYHYNEYIRVKQVQNINDEDIYKDPVKRIQECNWGKYYVAHPVRVFVDNLGPGVNGKYPDYAPVITADESVLIYTSRREGTTGDMIDEEDLHYYEDLYISYNDKQGWSSALNMTNLNTDEHDASVSMSADGQILFTYRGVPDGTLFVSHLEGDEWSKPKELNSNINTKYHETAASLSYDGKRLYFASTREDDGYGKPTIGRRDIFVSDMNSKGDWGPAKNVGEVINTKYDERGVFIHPDGRTMYFSSKGHETMGGFDIFYSEKDSLGNWGKPVNIGYPVNTPDDDVFFTVAGNARYAYYSSAKEDGFGYQDIYRITFLGPEKLMVLGAEDNLIASSEVAIQQKVETTDTVQIRKVRLTILKGTITDALSTEPIEAEIEIVDNAKDEVISVMKSNSKTGKYLVSLPSGKNYGIAVKAEDYLFYSENIDIPYSAAYQEVTKDIVLSKVSIGSKIILKNIFFDYDRATLRPESFPELNRLVKLLESYPRMRIEIGGHTDSHGSLAYNTTLSDNRAKSVVEYLIEKGIAADRLEYKGYAFTQPIATNDTDEGRQQNRRVEFKVLSIK
jgi:outer membrane protein OmpA-like peptidoglycan-associated protein